MNSLRGWRFLERGVLWTTLAVCGFVAAAPLRERLGAWQEQRALEAQWQLAVKKSRAHPALLTSVRTSPRRSKSKHHARPNNEQVLWPLVRLKSPKIGLDALVVEGTSEVQLKRGPGHEASTSLPGGPNCVIAAHRNAFGWWFYRLNSLHPGDSVVVETPGRQFVYRVAVLRIVSVHATSILYAPAKAAPRLTLYTCTLPKTQSRLVVIANLQSSKAT